MPTARIQENGLDNLTAGWVAYASTPKYLQWGTGTAAGAGALVLTSAATDTYEIANNARFAGTVSQATTTVTKDTFQVAGTLTANGVLAITEVGAFSAAGSGSPATGNSLCIYGHFDTINLAASDSIAFTIKVQFS